MAYGEYDPILDADGNPVMLGKGSFGKVYLVQKTKLGRRYALKLLGNEHLDKKSSARNRFLREVETFAGLHHPNIVNIADYGECEEGIYYVMDYCEGGSLETLVRNLRPFSVPLVLRLLDKSAAALEYAHGKGLIHRDIKPENLMLLSPADRDDDLPDLIRLIDFGLAKDLSAGETPEAGVHLTQESQVVGTPLYMSPEQLSGSVVDHRADIFSLGITAWYLLAGTQAFAHLHNGSLIRQDRFSAPSYKSKLPDRLTGKARDAIARMIEKEEGNRFQDYRSLREALKAALEDEHHSIFGSVDYRPEPASPQPLHPVPQRSGNDYQYTALTVLGPDPATGGSLLTGLCAGQSVQLITAPGHLAPLLSQMLGRLDVPERPPSVIHYHRHTYSANHPGFPGSCICTTQPPTGPDLLAILRNRKRVTLEESKGILQQIAEAMDFARPREINLRFAPGDIILPGLPPTPDTPALAAAEVRLYPTILVRNEADRQATLGATIAQDGNSTGAGIPTHRDFAALIYRVLAGREVEPGAFHSARKYSGISSLQARTDAILRDTISGIHPAQSCRALLLNLCSSESIRLPERTGTRISEPVIPPIITEPVAAPPPQPPPSTSPPPTIDQPPGTMVDPVIHDELLVDPPLWSSLPNSIRRQLRSCLRDTWELRCDIDKDHIIAMGYSTQSQTQIQQQPRPLKEAEEAARDIESCRRTLQDCYSQATLALHQIRDSTDPTMAEIRKRDIYGLLEIAEHARQDADSHFELLGKLGPRRDALLLQAADIERQAQALQVKAHQPLPEIPIIFLDETTRSQCAEVENEIKAIVALAAGASPVAAATAADALYTIESLLQKAQTDLTEAANRWQRISPSVNHLKEKLTGLISSVRELESTRQQALADIKTLQTSARFSADSAVRFDREAAALLLRLSPDLPKINALPEPAAVAHAAREATDAMRRLEDIFGQTARETSPDQIRFLLSEANAAKEAATEAVRRASAAHRDFTTASHELQEKARNLGAHLAAARHKANYSLTLLGTHRQNTEAAAKRAAEIASEHPAAQSAAQRARDLAFTLASLHSEVESIVQQAQNTEELDIAEAAVKRADEAVEKAAETARRAQTALEEAQRQLEDRAVRLNEARQSALNATSQAQTAATQIEALLDKATTENNGLHEADRTPAALAPLEAAARTARHAATVAASASTAASTATTPDSAETAAAEAARAAAEATGLLTKAQQDYATLATTLAGSRAAWSQARLEFKSALARIRELLNQTTTFRQSLLNPAPGTTPLTTLETSGLHLLLALPVQLDSLEQSFDGAATLAEATAFNQQANHLVNETSTATTMAQAAYQRLQEEQRLLLETVAAQEREAKLLANQAETAAREAQRTAKRIARHPKAGDTRQAALALANDAQNHADRVKSLAAVPITASTLADLQTNASATQNAAASLASMEAALPANFAAAFKWAAALILLGGSALTYIGMVSNKQDHKKETSQTLRLPATLTFGPITEKGKPKLNPEATFSLILDGTTTDPVPVVSRESIQLKLTDAQRSGGKALFLKISAPTYQDSSLIPITPGSSESFSVPPIELAKEIDFMVPKLPGTLTFGKLLPEEGIYLALKSSEILIQGGKPLILSQFGQFDPAQRLQLTAKAEGYEETAVIIEPGEQGSGRNIELRPIQSVFAWKSEPAGWFSGVNLTRLNPPKDPNLDASIEISSPNRKIPVGRYTIEGLWGRTKIPLGEITVKKGNQETAVAKWPFATKFQWTAPMDLNPKAVLSGPTGQLKQVATSWTIAVPAPVFVEFQPLGAATLRVTNSQIMQLSLFGMMAGSIASKEINDNDQISKTFRAVVIKPLMDDVAAGSSLGQWFNGFWQRQSLTKLSKSEEWRTSVFMQSQNQVAFLSGILTSRDPFPFLADSQNQTPVNNFFDTFTLQADSFNKDGLRLVASDNKATLVMSAEGDSGKLTAPSLNATATLKPRG